MADEKKPKGKRRNFAKIVADVERYCAISVEVIAANEPTDFQKGKIAAFNEIISKIGGK